MSENEEYMPNIVSLSTDELIDIANETVETNTITRRTLSTQTNNLDISSENIDQRLQELYLLEQVCSHRTHRH